ncbi:hypothetical protein ACJJTC_006366 [Scirpophaga incertulas]
MFEAFEQKLPSFIKMFYPVMVKYFVNAMLCIGVIERRLDSNQVNWAEVSSSLFRDVYIFKEDLVLSNISVENLGPGSNILSVVDPYHLPIEFSLSYFPDKLLVPTPNTKCIFHKGDYDNIIAHLDSIS